MPVTEENLTYDQMRQKERKGYTCAECGARLVLAWGGAYKINGYILRCPTDINHTGIAKKYELSAMQTPDDMQINPNMGRFRRKKLVQQLGEEKGTALAPYAGKHALTKQEAETVLDTLWPTVRKSHPAIWNKAMLLCTMCGANPLRKHIHIIEYKGKPEVVEGIDFKRILTRSKIKYSYLDMTPRHMSEEEEKKAYGKIDPSKIRSITHLKNLETGEEVWGFGEWPVSQTTYGTEKGANSPENMSMIHSESQALRRLAPDALDGDTRVVDERTMVIEDRKVDTVTGEIIENSPANAAGDQIVEGEAREIPETPEAEKTPTESVQQGTAQETKESITGKDETTVTRDQLADVTRLLKDAGIGEGELAKHLKGKPENGGQGWTFQRFADLQKWQYDYIVSYLKKAAGH